MGSFKYCGTLNLSKSDLAGQEGLFYSFSTIVKCLCRRNVIFWKTVKKITFCHVRYCTFRLTCLWSRMDPNSAILISVMMTFYDVIWRSVTFYGVLWRSITFNDVLWRSMTFYDIRCSVSVSSNASSPCRRTDLLLQLLFLLSSLPPSHHAVFTTAAATVADFTSRISHSLSKRCPILLLTISSNYRIHDL
jgi:hypothetical protein